MGGSLGWIQNIRAGNLCKYTEGPFR
uniref:Uncharacterized protein n=1 Tax=Rhizophora mucronata TaxID=61149 RepID=A0A2P2Q1X1_RHIMU